MPRLVAGALCAFTLLVAGRLHGEQLPPSDQERAQALFEQGRRALAAEDYETACEKFQESQGLDPGAGTLMNLATCEEQLGKSGDALAHFREALGMLPAGDDRVEFARARAAELEAKLVIEQAAEDAESAAASELAEEQPAAAGEKPAESRPPLLGWTLVGVGAAGVVTGITTSLLVAREQELVDRHCSGKLCDETGMEAAERGETLVVVNAAAYGIGVVALGAGIALLLSHDASEGVRARVGPHSAAIGYGGRF